MEGSNQKFQVQIETGAIMEAELITVVEIDSKEYAVYSIDNQNGTVDILASYVEKDEEGAKPTLVVFSAIPISVNGI